jgi:hypothetical protein
MRRRLKPATAKRLWLTIGALGWPVFAYVAIWVLLLLLDTVMRLSLPVALHESGTTWVVGIAVLGVVGLAWVLARWAFRTGAPRSLWMAVSVGSAWFLVVALQAAYVLTQPGSSNAPANPALGSRDAYVVGLISNLAIAVGPPLVVFLESRRRGVPAHDLEESWHS